MAFLPGRVHIGGNNIALSAQAAHQPKHCTVYDCTKQYCHTTMEQDLITFCHTHTTNTWARTIPHLPFTIDKIWTQSTSATHSSPRPQALNTSPLTTHKFSPNLLQHWCWGRIIFVVLGTSCMHYSKRAHATWPYTLITCRRGVSAPIFLVLYTTRSL